MNALSIISRVSLAFCAQPVQGNAQVKNQKKEKKSIHLTRGKHSHTRKKGRRTRSISLLLSSACCLCRHKLWRSAAVAAERIFACVSFQASLSFSRTLLHLLGLSFNFLFVAFLRLQIVPLLCKEDTRNSNRQQRRRKKCSGVRVHAHAHTHISAESCWTILLARLGWRECVPLVSACRSCFCLSW